MTAQTITGRVESVTLERQESQRAVRYGDVETPVKIALTLALDDERKAYVSTNVGRHVVGGSEPFAGMFANAYNPNVDEWPMAIQDQGTMHRSQSPEVFPRAVLLEMKIVPTVHRDDVLTIRGSVEEKVSRKGTSYIQVKRARVIKVERDGEVWSV